MRYKIFLCQDTNRSVVCDYMCSLHGLVLQPALVLEVKLLQILQRDVLLFFSASQAQPL